MEIERKFLINMEQLPFRPEDFPCRHIEQGYLCTAPVVRIRRDNEEYFLTYKSKGLMVREEYNLPLTKEAYTHLIPKADGRMIRKKRYVIPLEDGLSLELDIFEGDLAPLVLAEIEFPDEESGLAWRGCNLLRPVPQQHAQPNLNISILFCNFLFLFIFIPHYVA